MKVKKVTTCSTCPMMRMNEAWECSCDADGDIGMLREEIDLKVHDKCPLKNDSITIELEAMKIYHAKNPTFGIGGHPEFNEENFELVAEVFGKSLSDAFRLTNNIDKPWSKNKGVKVIKESRSTSVGDVVKLGNELHRCEMAGWSKIKN